MPQITVRRLRSRIHILLFQNCEVGRGPDSLGRQLRGNAGGQPDLPVFRSDIRRARRETKKRVYGTDVDDSTAMSARKHGAGLVLQTQKGTLQVRVENSIPFLLG